MSLWAQTRTPEGTRTIAVYETNERSVTVGKKKNNHDVKRNRGIINTAVLLFPHGERARPIEKSCCLKTEMQRTGAGRSLFSWKKRKKKKKKRFQSSARRSSLSSDPLWHFEKTRMRWKILKGIFCRPEGRCRFFNQQRPLSFLSPINSRYRSGSLFIINKQVFFFPYSAPFLLEVST